MFIFLSIQFIYLELFIIKVFNLRVNVNRKNNNLPFLPFRLVEVNNLKSTVGATYGLTTQVRLVSVCF